MNDLMSLIDDVKDSIPEGKYLELCNVMKGLYLDSNKTDEPIQPIQPSSARSDIINVLSLQNTYNKKYRLKKDRKIVLHYGTTSNIYIPHSVIINGMTAKWERSRKYVQYFDDEGICHFVVRLQDSLISYHIAFDTDIKESNTTTGCYEILYDNICIIHYDINELNIKREINKKYNN